MVELRDYQQDSLIYLSESKNERDMLCLPTGAGKAYIAVYFTGYEISQKRKTLILVHRKELLDQMYKGFLKAFNHHPKLITAGKATVLNSTDSIYLGMVETLSRRPKLLEQLKQTVDTLIIDESHFLSFRKVLDGFKRVIGFSATPQIVKKNDCLANYYHNIYEPTNIQKLIEEGYLLEPITYAPASLAKAIDRAGIKLNLARTDYDESAMTEALMEEKVFANAINEIEKRKKGRTLVFCAGVKHSQVLINALRERGHNAYHLDGNTKDTEREFIKRSLHEQSDCIVSNCGVLTTGFDEPRIETIVLNRLTKSENLLIQCIGRGSRKCDEIDKTDFVLLDLYGNTLQHGLWQDYRNWKERFHHIKPAGNGDAPVKICPRCEAVVPAPTKICPHCGFDFGKKDEEDLQIKHREEELQRIERDRLTEESIKIATMIKNVSKFKKAFEKGQSEGWSKIGTIKWYLKKISPEPSREELIEMRKVLGYAPGWERHWEDFKAKFIDQQVLV